jgi:alpha-methylacyl-CoA racemase
MTAPLAGIRVLELGGIGPGPHAAMLLADLGADVVRLERPGGFAGAIPAGAQDWLMRGRRSVAVDLKEPADLLKVQQLIGRCDVLIDGFRPGVTERLGIGPQECCAANRRLIYARITGWGQDGPLARQAGHDINYLSITGVLHAIGAADAKPVPPLNLVGDFGGGGMLLAFGICAALWERQRSGLGQVVDASVVDGTVALLAQAWGARAAGQWQDQRGVNRLDTGLPWYDVYETSDGQWLSVGALEPQFWAEFTRILGVADLPDRDDPARREELRAAIAVRIRERTRDDWDAAFAGSDACVAPVLSMTEATSDAHLAARRTYRDQHDVMQPAPAPRFSRTPGSLGAPPPVPGEHTRAALTDWGVEDVDGLIAAGVVQDAPG